MLIYIIKLVEDNFKFIVFEYLIKPPITNKIIMKGNSTRNQDKPDSPILHNQDRINVHIKANNNFPKTARIGIPPNKPIIMLSIANAKYNFAGVQILLKSLVDIIIIYINIIFIL
jgi:hypothetical protein